MSWDKIEILFSINLRPIDRFMGRHLGKIIVFWIIVVYIAYYLQYLALAARYLK